MLRRLFRRRLAPVVSQPTLPLCPPEPPAGAGVAPPPESPVQADPRRLEIYLGQIGDLPEHDRAIIIGVLQGILDEEAADQADTAR